MEQPTFASSRTLVAAIRVTDALRYTEHATRPGRPRRTVCGKVVAAYGWHLSYSTFDGVTGFTPERTYTSDISDDGLVTRQATAPIYISGLACETCVRLVYGYVRCPDCIPDYHAIPTQYPMWIRSNKRGARCETHTISYANAATRGEQSADGLSIVVSNVNSREHIRLTAHVRDDNFPYSTVCGFRIRAYYEGDKYGFVDAWTMRYTARSWSQFLANAERSERKACSRCESYMRKIGYATARPVVDPKPQSEKRAG